MILREATAADLRPLAAFTKRELDALGVRHTVTLAHLRRIRHRFRFVLLEEGAEITAALAALPIETEDGPGFQVTIFIVARGHPDRIRALDALCLYACNLAVSEGRYAIVSYHDTRAPIVYGRDYLGMEGAEAGVDTETGRVAIVHQRGDARAIIRNILRRRPEWRL